AAFALFGTAANIVFAVGIAYLPLPESVLEAFEQQYAALYGSNLALEIVTAAIVTPIVEEIIFRGIAMTRLTPAFGSVGAVIVSAVIFALAHGTPVAMIYTVVVGVLLAVIYDRYRSILPTIVFHMFFNLTAYWIGYLGEAVLTAAFIVSLILLAGLFVTQIVRYPRFDDILFDTAGRILPDDEEERRIVGEIRRLRGSTDASIEEMKRLADEWAACRNRKKKGASSEDGEAEDPEEPGDPESPGNDGDPGSPDGPGEE
ncbi:MAG: CPBP family intramembrane metalloprotease, partial [Firmicutes bacterium]|nr:CPBP family intramembrane metalloprotease [Bacillota bacterium]